jgi:hypothetical protein
MRALVAQTRPAPADQVLPMFVREGLAEVLGQVAQGDVEDAVGIGAGRPHRVLVLITRHTEQH